MWAAAKRQSFRRAERALYGGVKEQRPGHGKKANDPCGKDVAAVRSPTSFHPDERRQSYPVDVLGR